MTNIYSFPGMCAAILLVICSCAYMRRVPQLRKLFLSEKRGAMGTLYKASVIGTRLHAWVSLSCGAMALYLLLLK